MRRRESTAADRPALEELVAAYLDEHWSSPFPPPPRRPVSPEGRIVVAEEDGEIVGLAKGELSAGLGHVSLVYFRPEARGKGGGNELMRELVAYFREQGFQHVSLNVELPNDEALAYWRRLGFTDYRRSLLTDLDSLEKRLEGRAVPATGSVHVQTDDQAPSRKPSPAGCPASCVRGNRDLSAAERWIGVYDEAAEPQPERLRKLASELSYVSGGVVIALSIEQGDSCGSWPSTGAGWRTSTSPSPSTTARFLLATRSRFVRTRRCWGG